MSAYCKESGRTQSWPNEILYRHLQGRTYQ